MLVNVVNHHGGGVEIVQRDVKKSLNLSRMQIHRQAAMGTGDGNQIRHQFGGDGCARSRFSVLARIAIIRHESRDAPSRTASESIQRNQQLHRMIIGWSGGGLHKKHILTTHILQNFNKQLAIAKTTGGNRPQLQA